MRRFIGLLFFIGIILTASNVFAGAAYIGFDSMFVEYREPGISTDLGVLGIKVGVNTNDYLSIESRAGFGFDYATEYVDGVPVDLDLDHVLGLYLRGGIPWGPIKPYGIIGVTTVKATASTLWDTISANETDFSYGLGIEMFLGEQASFNIEHIRLIDKEYFELNSSNVGFNIYF